MQIQSIQKASFSLKTNKASDILFSQFNPFMVNWQLYFFPPRMKNMWQLQTTIVAHYFKCIQSPLPIILHVPNRPTKLRFHNFQFSPFRKRNVAQVQHNWFMKLRKVEVFKYLSKVSVLKWNLLGLVNQLENWTDCFNSMGASQRSWWVHLCHLNL